MSGDRDSRKRPGNTGPWRESSVKILANQYLMEAAAIALMCFIFVGCESEWRVARVIDGDTVWVRKGLFRKKVRLKGVDAPEIPHPKHGRPTGEFYGYEAKTCLAELLDANTLRLEFDTPGKTPEFDKYGRMLAYIYQGERLINAELIEKGCARAYRSFPHSRSGQFLELEQKARRQGVGMWAKNPPTGRRKSE